jgi:hypothetical protein
VTLLELLRLVAERIARAHEFAADGELEEALSVLEHLGHDVERALEQEAA